jgi:hypothetical protein
MQHLLARASSMILTCTCLEFPAYRNRMRLSLNGNIKLRTLSWIAESALSPALLHHRE